MNMFAALMVVSAFVNSTNGVKLWTMERGQGSPIVVIHGGPGMDHDTLAADLQPLERLHRLIYYDQRGGGQSTLPADTSLLTIDHYVEDLEAVRKFYGLDKLTILAHSFGPAVAALYAIKYPQHVDRMILIGPIPPMRGKFFDEFGATLQSRLTKEQRDRAAELQKQWTTGDARAICREYWSIMTPPRLATTSSPDVVKSDFCTAPPAAIAYGMTKTNPKTFASLGDWDWRPQLAHVMAPALIIHGEQDAIPMSMVSAWATSMPNAHLMRVRNAAHFPYAEQPQIVFTEIEAFLRRR